MNTQPNNQTIVNYHSEPTMTSCRRALKLWPKNHNDPQITKKNKILWRHFVTDYDLLGLHDIDWYINICLPFGYRHGSALFQCISDAQYHIMHQHNFDVINCIDDIFGVDLLSKSDTALGFDISERKLVAPTTSMNCLGIQVDTINLTLAIPEKIMQKFWVYAQNGITKITVESMNCISCWAAYCM